MTINSYLFLSLIIVSTVFFLYILWKERDTKILVLYMFMAGLTYTYEYIIFIWFRSYNYFPHILDNPFYDSIIGAISSNGFTIPILTVIIAVFRVRWLGRTVFAILLMGVEEIFLYAGAYEHNWYKTIFTGIGIMIAFVIADAWLSKLRNDISHFVRFFSIFLSSFFLKSSIMFISSGILERFIFTVGWFDNPYRDSIAFFTLLNMFGSLVIAIIIMYRLTWRWVLIGLVFLTSVDYVLIKLQIVHLMNWTILGFVIGHVLLFTFGYVVNQHLLKKRGVTVHSTI